MSRSLCLACLLFSTSAALAASTIIKYTATDPRWAAIYGITGDPNAGLVEPGAGWNGGWNGGHGFFSIGIFDITGLTLANASHVVLRIPRQDDFRAGTQADYEANALTVYHIVAGSNTAVTVADATSAASDTIGVYRAAGPISKCFGFGCYVDFDVTAAVQADITAGRTTFAYRLQHDQSAAYHGYARFAVSASNPLMLIALSTGPENCGNNLDDNSDGLTDCDDPWCGLLSTQQPCHETSCSDGLDNDFDGKVDCDDSDCIGKPGCTTAETDCMDGLDNDGDGQVDCRDSDCFGHVGCTHERVCNDNKDNDNDGLIDCADPDCFGQTGCTNEASGSHSTCGDGADNNRNCLTDGADPDCAATGTLIKPVSAQDNWVVVAATVGGSSLGPVNYPFWIYGQQTNCLPYAAIAKVTLPPGLDPNTIGKAVLEIPNCDVLWFVEPSNPAASVSAMNLVAYHIDGSTAGGSDDTQVTTNDGLAPSLGALGVYRAPGPRVQSGSRFTSLDVTQPVKDDITAGRPTFSFRIQYDQTPSVCDSAAYYSPSVDSTDGFFPASNRGARLRLLLPGTYETSCTDGIDNDGDGAIDCNDADCYGNAACHGSEICGNKIDDDLNGLTDCADPACVGTPCCLPKENTNTLCANGTDDDLNTFIDCADAGCANAPNCKEQACNDGIDNDNDGLTDCADPDCAAYVLCQYAKPFADRDHDGDVDQDDFGKFQDCYSGSGHALLNTGCSRWDRDVDNDVDTDDFNAFVACVTGPGVPFNVGSPPVGCKP